MSPATSALPHLEVVEAHTHLAHPLSEGRPQNPSGPAGLFHGVLRNPGAVLETAVGLVPPSQPSPGVSVDDAQDGPLKSNQNQNQIRSSQIKINTNQSIKIISKKSLFYLTFLFGGSGLAHEPRRER